MKIYAEIDKIRESYEYVHVTAYIVVMDVSPTVATELYERLRRSHSYSAQALRWVEFSNTAFIRVYNYIHLTPRTSQMDINISINEFLQEVRDDARAFCRDYNSNMDIDYKRQNKQYIKDHSAEETLITNAMFTENNHTNIIIQKLLTGYYNLKTMADVIDLFKQAERQNIKIEAMNGFGKRSVAHIKKYILEHYNIEL